MSLRNQTSVCQFKRKAARNRSVLMPANAQAFSMVEVLIAAVILSISVIGVLATMSAQKGPAVESDTKVQAALAAKQFLENLRAKVDATTYDTGDLALGAHNNVPFGAYMVNYVVSTDGSARKVDLNISW